jgi:hypothetical protein
VITSVEQTLKNDYRVYPNPSTDVFNTNVTGLTSIKVLDVNGAAVESVNNTNGAVRFGTGLSKGIYVVQFQQGNNLQTVKVVKR